MRPDDKLLERIRKLLAKAEGTDNEHERETFMAAATALMAKYGIERAALGDTDPATDRPANRIITVESPWAMEKARLLCGIGQAVRCRCIIITQPRRIPRVHVFGYESDIERAELLYTSLLLQMASGLGRVQVPPHDSPRAYRRSWLLGFIAQVVSRIEQAEETAVAEHTQARSGTGRSTDLVLRDRDAVIYAQFRAKYPNTRTSRTRFSGYGFAAGAQAGRTANIGATTVSRSTQSALGGAR